MAVEIGSMFVAFTADLSRYEAAMRKGEKSTDRFEQHANKAVAGVGNAFIKMGGLAKAGLAGLAAGLIAGGVTETIARLGEVAKGIAEIGDEAKRAGVSAKTFQEWKFVAEQNRIGIDAMTDGLKELNLRADEFVQTGKGSAAEAFQRLGYTAADLKEKLKDPSALLLEIIDRLGKFDKAAQIRISDEVFGGTAGERFVELLAQGRQGISETIQRAHDLGIVMDDDVIAKAAELDRRFNEVASTVGTALKSAIVSAADSLQEFIDGFRDFQNQQTRTLQNRQTAIMGQKNELAQQIKDAQAERDALGNTGAGGMLDEGIRGLKEQMAALDKQENDIIAILSDRSEFSGMKRSGDNTWTPPTPPPGGFGSSSGGRDREAAKAEREAEAVRRLIDDLQHEKDLIGATDLERDVSNTLRQAGASATEEQRAKIIGLVAAIHAETEAQRQSAEAQQLYGDIAKGVMSDLRGALSDGKLSWEELGDVALNVLETVTDRDRDIHLESIINGKE